MKISKGKILPEVYSDDRTKGSKNNTLRIQNPLSKSQVPMLFGTWDKKRFWQHPEFMLGDFRVERRGSRALQNTR